MTIIKNFIEDFNVHSPFETFYKHGIKPDDIKPAIVKTLSPYFNSIENLEELSTSHLVAGWVNFMLFKRDRWFLNKFEKCLDLYNKAKLKNSKLLFSSIIEILPYLNQAVTKFWSVKNLEIDKSNLENEEYLESCLTMIGQILEGLTKSYLKLTLSVTKIDRDEEFDIQNIFEQDLGVIINELIEKTNFEELFKPPPWDLKLNQWRNIAYHHTAHVQNQKFVLVYKSVGNKNSIILTRSELFTAVKTLYNVYNTFRNVEFIFIYNNLKEYQEECKLHKPIDYEIRNEVKYLELCSNINSQGFKIIDLIINDDSAILLLQDMICGNIQERSIHSSMFLYHLWMYTDKDNLMIEYRNKKGDKILQSNTNSSVCKSIGLGKESIDYLAEKVEFKLFNKKTYNQS